MREPRFSGFVERNEDRRRFLKQLGVGATVVAFGGLLWRVAGRGLEAEARAQKRPDGRPRLPPGQRLLTALRPMGGVPGDPDPGAFKLRVHGEVERELTLDFKQLLALPQIEQASDVHCVTGWTVLGARWKGVRVSELAKAAGVKKSARHVVFEAAAGYTANVLIAEAMAPDALIAHQLDGRTLPQPHGPPARALVPSLYFWKSAKWITGVRFVTRDEPGYWETRGYHNHADPWLEERYG